ncbi:11664_t:CDS:2 [Entrophospora sp. SA101]|nr:15262_t:CDS:2 [Entrophospora sp. SA101]CAJ0631964.1 11664_t:CDS:2 [Entrophospora sp. SA101]CAJ0850246.1 100_t:CDS:2 [Entrophospora sp. SA101]CAJ0909841.1 10460_t:CDS:2 [Entrophospora sp. SA101]
MEFPFVKAKIPIMKCKNCNINKLSREFPKDVISGDCKHIPGFCLKCVVTYLNASKTNKCPECKALLNQKGIKRLNSNWENASFMIKVDSISTLNNPSNNQSGGGYFYVVMMNGTVITLSLEKVKTVIGLKRAIKSETNLEISKQKLLYNGNELKSHLQLIVLLYSITKGQSFKNLTFDLHWGFPDGERDYLDGTCLLYRDNFFYERVDWANKSHSHIPNIFHSGDKLNFATLTGHHCIKANLADLPPEITRLYFILSSWNAPNIGHFPNLSFKLYDTEKPDDQLCSCKLKYAASSSAIIMCVVIRNIFNNTWDIFEIGESSTGNAKNYTSIKSTISSLSTFFK